MLRSLFLQRYMAVGFVQSYCNVFEIHFILIISLFLFILLLFNYPANKINYKEYTQ